MAAPVSGNGFATALLINFIVFLVIVVIFNVLRRWTMTSKFYTPKRYVLYINTYGIFLASYSFIATSFIYFKNLRSRELGCSLITCIF